MITIVIAVVILTIGIPSFRTILLNNQRAAAANEFLASVNYTRSEALNRRAQVILCQTKTVTAKAGDDIPCGDGTGYESGWIVYVPTADKKKISTLLRASEPLTSGITLRGNATVATNVVFGNVGQAVGSNGSFRLCDSRAEAANSRVFVIATGGRIRSINGDPATTNPDKDALSAVTPPACPAS